jgi:hypothetical protein
MTVIAAQSVRRCQAPFDSRHRPGRQIASLQGCRDLRRMPAAASPKIRAFEHPGPGRDVRVFPGASCHLSVGAGLQVSTPWERSPRSNRSPQAGQVRSELTNTNSAGARARSQSSGSLPIPVMRAVPGGAGVPTAGAWGIAAPRPVQCCAGPGYPPGEATTCPARCDHTASRPDAATTRLALRLTILPPGLPPNGTGRRMGRRSRVRAKEPVREVMAEIFSADWNCPASVRQRHTGSDLGFAYELNAGPSPCTGRGPRIGRRKPA